MGGQGFKTPLDGQGEALPTAAAYKGTEVVMGFGLFRLCGLAEAENAADGD